MADNEWLKNISDAVRPVLLGGSSSVLVFLHAVVERERAFSWLAMFVASGFGGVGGIAADAFIDDQSRFKTIGMLAAGMLAVIAYRVLREWLPTFLKGRLDKIQ